MVQKYISQICQKLAIAAALAAALCCLPVAAQNTQANEILILNDKPVTFSEFLKTHPNQAVRSKLLATLDEKTEDAFRDWEMAQLNKRSAEQDAEMARLNKRSAEQDVALELSQGLGAALDEIYKLDLFKTLTTEQKTRNINYGNAVLAALANPRAHKLTPATKLAMEELGKKLQAGEDYDSAYKKLMVAAYSTSK